jgi:hypothetical protein
MFIKSRVRISARSNNIISFCILSQFLEANTRMLTRNKLRHTTPQVVSKRYASDTV